MLPANRPGCTRFHSSCSPPLPPPTIARSTTDFPAIFKTKKGFRLLIVSNEIDKDWSKIKSKIKNQKSKITKNHKKSKNQNQIFISECVCVCVSVGLVGS